MISVHILYINPISIDDVQISLRRDASMFHTCGGSIIKPRKLVI